MTYSNLLEQRADEFHQATERLQQSYCGKGCNKPDNCNKSGICRTSVEQANLASLRYKGVLEEIEQESGAIPYEYAEKFEIDVSKCIGLISKMNQGNSGIWGFVQQMDVRREIIRDLKKH